MDTVVFARMLTGMDEKREAAASMMGLASAVAGAATVRLGLEEGCERVAAGGIGRHARLFGSSGDRGIAGPGQVLLFQERREVLAARCRESGASGGTRCTERPG